MDDLKNHVVSGTAALVRSRTVARQTPTVQIGGKGDMVLTPLRPGSVPVTKS